MGNTSLTFYTLEKAAAVYVTLYCYDLCTLDDSKEVLRSSL